jgi:RecJ-like exonuclease
MSALVSLPILYFYSLSIGPSTVPIGDLHEGLVGNQVQVVGLVEEARLTSGGLALDLYDPLDGSQVAVFVPERVYEDIQGKEDVLPGAELLVRGTLQVYKGRLEIVVTSPAGLSVLQPAG